MSCEAIAHVWHVEGVTAEERLLLIWLADSTAYLGCAVMVDHYEMGRFIGSDYYRAAAVLADLERKSLIRAGSIEEETSSYLWIVHDGEYDPPIDWMRETKNRSSRIAALIERDGAGCTYCRRMPITYHIDHFVPKSRGGEDRLRNLVLACADCNMSKRDKMPEEFLRDRPELFRVISTNLKYQYEDA